VASTSDQLKVLLGDTAFRVLESLAGTSSPVSGRAIARGLNISPTTATAALATLQRAGFAACTVSGRSSLWYVDEANATVRDWLDEVYGVSAAYATGSRPKLTAVVFTALELEYRAVAFHLPQRRLVRVRTTRFESGSFAGNRVDWTVHVAELGAGNTRAAIELAAAVTELDPDLVLFVGVAGSVKPKDLCRGDVIVADRVYNIHSGKDSRNEVDESVHLTRPLSFPAAHGAIQLAMAVRRSDWLAGLADQALNANGKVPQVEIRPIAAGEVVHSDDKSALMTKVRAQFNDAAAVDMESLGLYEAAHKDGLPALAVRGISDCVGDKQPDSDGEWQPRAAGHAAAFAFALLRVAEPEDLPRQGGRFAYTQDLPPAGAQSPVEMLLRLPPPVALAYEWALPLAKERAAAALEEFTKLGGQPATWLSRFRHRPPPLFREERSAALWVMAAEYADSFQHPVAPWLYKQAAERWEDDDVLSAYLYGRAAVCAAGAQDLLKADELLDRAEAIAPAGRLLWAFFRAAIRPDLHAAGAATVAIADAFDLGLPGLVLQALGASSTDVQPDENLTSFVEEFAERLPAFLEQVRLMIALAAARLLQRTPGELSTSQMFLERLTEGLPPYKGDPAAGSALRALVGPRSSNVLLALATTLYMRATGSGSRDMSFDRDVALARAQELAQTARDRRQDWGGPTGEPLAVAAKAQAATGDTRGALRLLVPPPAGTAMAAEAASQDVVRAASELAVGTGNIGLALELAPRIDDLVERRLTIGLALTMRKDSQPEAAVEYRAVLAERDLRADQQMRALLGLSMADQLSEDELARLEALDGEAADLVRAQSFLTAGRTSQAMILARRYPDSDGAVQIRVDHLLSQGKTADAIKALETYAVRQNDERFLLDASVLALSSGAADEAARLARRLASSNNAARRRTAGEVLIDTASSQADWETVLSEARKLLGDEAVAEADPARGTSLGKYRWAQAHALYQLRRMDEAYQIIRREPRLVPADVNQARLVVSILRTVAPAATDVRNHPADTERDITQAEILEAVTEAAQAFPEDEELIATAVMTAFAMPASEPPDFGLMTKARELHQQFLERFPDSTLIKPIPLGDALSGLQELMRTQVAPTAEVAEQLHRQAFTGQLPISACVTALGRNYAEALIRNTFGCYVITYADDSIFTRETDAARQALDETVVVDTSALFLSRIILGQVNELRTHFEQLLVTASQRDDILQARASLMMRSAGWLGWDPILQRPIFMEHSAELTERWAAEANDLARALDGCEVIPDPVITDPPTDYNDPRQQVWSSSIRLARDRGVSLVADDAALRAAAWSEGVQAFGSLQLLSALISNGDMPATALGDSYERLMAIKAADLPIRQRLQEIAQKEQWEPAGYAAFLLRRPSTWIPLADGWNDYTTLIRALPEKGPEVVASWCSAAIYGLCLIADPSAAPALAAGLVVCTLLELRDPAILPSLLANARYVVARFVREADLIKEIVQRLVKTVRQVAKLPEMVASTVLPLLSGLEKEDHAEAIHCFFTMS